MRLISIPEEKFADYRREVIFDGYKWDPQFLDSSTVSQSVLLLSAEEHQQLVKLTEKLGWETMAAEQFINENQHLSRKLALPRKLRQEIKKMSNYDPARHIRLMRFDFHPLQKGGWAISEVNSDVPGGYAESSLMPAIAQKYLQDSECYFQSFSEVLLSSIEKKVLSGGRIMLVHCTSYSDDRQVMQYLGDQLLKRGYGVLYGAGDHLQFHQQKAISVLNNKEGEVAAIVRFSPLEWIIDIKPKRWAGYFDTTTTSCNHPVAIYTQSKRFPLLWEELEASGIELSTWRRLLPETLTVAQARNKSGFIYKPVWGRVGEGISIKEASRGDEYEKIIRDVRKYPWRYVSQQRFESKPLFNEAGEAFHVCLGAYNVEGQAAGYYARISNTPRIDSRAADIPVLIERIKK